MCDALNQSSAGRVKFSGKRELIFLAWSSRQSVWISATSELWIRFVYLHAKCHKKALAFRKSEGEFRGHQREDIWRSLICTSKSKSANCRLKLLRSEVKTSHSLQQQRTSAAKKSLKITHLETRIMKLFHLSCYKHCFITQASSTELFLMCRWDLTDILSDIHWSVKNNRIGYVLHFLRLFFLQITQTSRSPEYP